MKNSNELNVPQAREAMDKFKMQAAQEMGVNLKQGYNGDLTSREAGSVGGQMVKKMIEAYESGMQYRTREGVLKRQRFSFPTKSHTPAQHRNGACPHSGFLYLWRKGAMI